MCRPVTVHCVCSCTWLCPPSSPTPTGSIVLRAHQTTSHRYRLTPLRPQCTAHPWQRPDTLLQLNTETARLSMVRRVVHHTSTLTGCHVPHRSGQSRNSSLRTRFASAFRPTTVRSASCCCLRIRPLAYVFLMCVR